MWALVVPIYESGKRRPARQLRDWPALGGQLTVGDAVDPDLPGRPRRIARLLNAQLRGKKTSCVPLYDPELISMDEKGFLLRGFNIVDVPNGPPELHVQGWKVQPRDQAFIVSQTDER
jgi:hypothetical protein